MKKILIIHYQKNFLINSIGINQHIIDLYLKKDQNLKIELHKLLNYLVDWCKKSKILQSYLHGLQNTVVLILNLDKC